MTPARAPARAPARSPVAAPVTAPVTFPRRRLDRPPVALGPPLFQQPLARDRGHAKSADPSDYRQQRHPASPLAAPVPACAPSFDRVSRATYTLPARLRHHFRAIPRPEIMPMPRATQPDAGRPRACASPPLAIYAPGGFGCTWPMWADGDRPPIAASPPYCGRPRREPAASYCDAHMAVAYPERAAAVVPA